MRKHHTELPALAAAARSVGVVTTKIGDFEAGEGLSKRTVCVAAGGRESDGEGGNGIVWTGCRDIEERISMTGEGTKDEGGAEDGPEICDMGTEPGGRIEKT